MSTHKNTKSGLQPGAGEKGINLSKEKPAKQEKSELIEELFAIMDGVEGRVYVADMQTYKILRVNKYTEKHYGKNLVGKKCYEVFQEGQDRPCSFCTNDRLIVEGRPGPPVVWDFQDAKTRLWYHCIDRAIRWPDGRFVRMEITIDITERKKAEIALCMSENFLDTIFDSINDPFNIIDRDFRIIRANDLYARMRGKTVEQLIGRQCYEVLQNRDDVCEECSVEETFESARPHTKEKLVSFSGGSHVWIEIFTHPVFDESGDVVNVIEYTRDITKRKKAEAERDILVDKLQYLSRTDDLTGLLNRRALIEKLEDEIRRAQRYKTKLAVLICDIDYFKEINDTNGHDTGDRILQIISNLFKESLRSIDIVGRYGGDEFLVILPETAMKGAKEIAERIRSTVEDVRLQREGKEPIKTTVSLGVTEFNSDKENINDLIKRADNALYMAKGKGRNRVYIIGN
jgi:diguanylate cyclase (GGDEF)-like protein/PAS domain S-box-containing protein